MTLSKRKQRSFLDDSQTVRGEQLRREVLGGGSGGEEGKLLLRCSTFVAREKHVVNRKLQDLQFALFLDWYQR